MRRRRAMGIGLSLALVVGIVGLAVVWFGRSQTYTVKGRVAGVEDSGRTLYVEHEEIPGYMPAMTMPLPVDDPDQAASLASGEAIRFQLEVNADSAWISRIEPISDSTVARHPARTVRPMGGDSETGRQLLREGDRVPADLTLTDQRGRTFRLGDFRGQALVLTFIYTRCPLPNYCPLMSKRFATLQPQLRDRFGPQAHLLSISFDPAYDTPKVLREYATRYTDRLDTWTFATGDSTEIQQITEQFGVFTEKDGGEIVHNLTTAVIGPEGRIRRIYRGQDWQPDEVVDVVERVVPPGSTNAGAVNP